MNINKRANLIRAATPNILEELFEMQNRICDLCNQPIQDLILAALDHSTPVIAFARGPLPIKEAVQQANDPINLRATHSHCNKRKQDMTREEWFGRGVDKKVGKQTFLTLEEIEEFRERSSRGGRIGGQTNARSGHLKKIASSGGRAGGPKGGKTNVETGQIQALGHSGIGGKIAGRKAVENGSWAKISILGSSKGGQATNKTTNGRKGNGGRMVSQNKIGIFSLSPQERKASAQRAAHVLWHVKRGIISLDCPLCS